MAKKVVNWSAKHTIWIAAWMLCATLRIRRKRAESFEEFQKENKPSVVAFWHGSMLVGWFLHRPRNGHTVAALVSQSEDGAILSATLARWGYTLIRGSSHIGGKEAMQVMVNAVEQGNSLCITPDGPTGPRHQMKMGAVRVAQRTQVPLFLVGISIKKKKILKSWDQFEIPLPFSTVDVYYSEPVMVSLELKDTSLNDFLIEQEKQLEELNSNAEAA